MPSKWVDLPLQALCRAPGRIAPTAGRGGRSWRPRPRATPSRCDRRPMWAPRRRLRRPVETPLHTGYVDPRTLPIRKKRSPARPTGSPHPSGWRPTPRRFRALRIRSASGSGLRARPRACARRPPGLRAAAVSGRPRPNGAGSAARHGRFATIAGADGWGVGVRPWHRASRPKTDAPSSRSGSPARASRPKVSPDYRAGPFYP